MRKMHFGLAFAEDLAYTFAVTALSCLMGPPKRFSMSAPLSGPVAGNHVLALGLPISAMSQIPGLDTTEALTADVVRKLKVAGIKFVIKYCSNTARYPSKRLSHAERALLVGAGIKSGFVSERLDAIDGFSAVQGAADAASVLAYFADLGVAKGVTCFFAVDFDATAKEIAGPIAAYAKAFHCALQAAGYQTGVYGSGLTCQALKRMGLVLYTWKAQSTGWSGYSYFGWDIRQQMGSVCGLASDPDTATTLGWAW